jgi:hypothetical protein
MSFRRKPATFVRALRIQRNINYGGFQNLSDNNS